MSRRFPASGTGSREERAQQGVQVRPACSPTARRLLEAAADLFLSAGIEETRVHDIAARAGFTTGTVYASFEGKAALLAAVLAECGDDMVVPLLELLGAEGPAVDVLMSLAQGGGHGERADRPASPGRLLCRGQPRRQRSASAAPVARTDRGPAAGAGRARPCLGPRRRAVADGGPGPLRADPPPRRRRPPFCRLRALRCVAAVAD